MSNIYQNYQWQYSTTGMSYTVLQRVGGLGDWWDRWGPRNTYFSHWGPLAGQSGHDHQGVCTCGGLCVVFMFISFHNKCMSPVLCVCLLNIWTQRHSGQQPLRRPPLNSNACAVAHRRPDNKLSGVSLWWYGLINSSDNFDPNERSLTYIPLSLRICTNRRSAPSPCR